MGRRLRGRQKSHRGKDAGTKDVGTCPLSSVAIPDSSSTDEAIHSTSELSRCPTLQPITSFSALSGLSNVVLPSGMSAGTSRAHVINNSSVIEILVHLLCREREPDPERRKKLFLALCKVIKQWNSPMYIPLHSFSELQDFRIGLLRKFEFLFEEVQSQIHSETTNLIIPSFQLLPTGSPLTQLALTDAYQHQFLDDRYSREFTEISPLGKGGFGSVVKARSKLDGHDYAIKIIIMHKKDNQTNKKILREVQALALLDHPNIVRYHTTWLQLYIVTPQHWPHNHRLKRRHPGDKVRINNFFPTSQVKIQELSSSREESSGGIVFADVSRSKSSFMKSADEETEESSSGIVFAEVSRSKTSIIKTIDEATEESSGGIVFADVSRSKSNLKKKVNVCQTINETGESSFDLTACSSGNKNGKIIQKGSVLNGDRFKLNINSIYSESTHSHLVNSEHSRSLLTDSSYSKITVNKDDSVCKKKMLYSPPSSSSLVPYKKHLREAQMTLFIQMGLCGETLADWISKRNAVQAPGIWLDSVNPEKCLEIFRQLLLAVQYIHTQNIIHRDLKPPNVFFTKDGKHIQLGDFGLARHLPDVVQPETDDSEKMTCLTPITNNTSNTGGVGTPIYSPPELKFGGIYGNKSDMYNLGIILLELFHPFQTGSERVKVISDLKEKQYIDPDLKHRYPKVASWILKLTDQDQSKRLTAAELLELISNRELLKEHYSDHFKSDSYTVVQETEHVRHRVQISESGSQNSRNSLNSRLNDLKISQPEELGSGSCPPGSESTPVDLRNLKSILKENKDKDKEIEKLTEENIKLQKVIAQLREQINQSVS